VSGGRQHDDLDDQAQYIHSQASFPTWHLLRGIPACRGGWHSDGGVNTLRVQNDEARVG
jgi:hypothetical protein